jgi:hypothetical protein
LLCYIQQFASAIFVVVLANRDKRLVCTGTAVTAAPVPVIAAAAAVVAAAVILLAVAAVVSVAAELITVRIKLTPMLV